VEVIVIGRDLWVEYGKATAVEEADELAKGRVSLVLQLCCGLGKRTVAPKAQMSVGVNQAIDSIISGLLNTGVPTSSPSLAYLLSLLIVEPKSASCTSVISCDSDATSTSMFVGLMSSAQSACFDLVYEKFRLTSVYISISMENLQCLEHTFRDKLELRAS
jgi:hypothetical protein